MKKTFVLFLVIIFLFAFVGCTSNKEGLTEKTNSIVEENEWEGIWTREGSWGYNDGKLTISNVTEESFDFEMSVLNGAHSGEISGTAIINDNVAVFEEANKMEEDDKEEVLKVNINFTRDNDVISVEPSGHIGMYSGAGVGFDGNYIKDYKIKVPSLVELGVFENDSQEEIFKNLVGTDYESFVCLYRNPYKYTDEENSNIEVIAGGVTGLYTISEAIIIKKSENEIWAAIIGNDKLKYYTNTSDVEKLPEIIENWRAPFNDMEIIYVNK